MAIRKSFLGPSPQHPELDRLLNATRLVEMSDAQFEEQRISFAYGNAPEGSGVTKDSVRSAAKSIRLRG